MEPFTNQSTGKSIKRVELGLNKIILYSLDSYKLVMIDPNHIIDNFTRNILAQKPPFPGTLSAPFKVFITITYQCNLNCLMCLNNHSTSTKPTLSLNEITPFIEQCGRNGVFEIRLNGGEPTIHPDFFEIIKLIDNAGMNSSINTNGVYSIIMLEKLIKSPIQKFHISLDGPQIIHEKLRGNKTFKKTINSICKLRDAGKHVRINTMVFKDNKDMLESIVNIAQELKTPIRFASMLDIGKASASGFGREKELSIVEWEEIKKDLCKLENQTNVPIIFKSNIDIGDFSQCMGGHASIHNAMCSPNLTQLGVDSDGNVYAGGCADDISISESVGTMKNSLQELWYNANYQVKNNLLKKSPKCSSCTPKLLWRSWASELSLESNRSRHLF